MRKVIVLRKKEGETPLQALERFRAGHKKYREIKMTYAGRLDPLVSGLLLVLSGEGIKEKEEYLRLSKEYAFEALFGFATDTHDILGKVATFKTVSNVSSQKIKENMEFFTGKFEQEYPLYSSPSIKQARLTGTAKIKRHEVEVKTFRFLGLRQTSGSQLQQAIIRRIGKVEGDFRQAEILSAWQRHLKGKGDTRFFIGRFYVKCGSGMYVRQLAQDLGKKMGIPALAYRIKRTKIGKFAKITPWTHKTS